MDHHLAAAQAWLNQHEVPTLDVDYQHTMAHPTETAARLAAFIPGFQAEPAAAAVIPKAAR